MSQRASLKEVFPSIGLELGKKDKSPGREGGGGKEVGKEAGKEAGKEVGKEAGKGEGEGRTKRHSQVQKPSEQVQKPSAQAPKPSAQVPKPPEHQHHHHHRPHPAAASPSTPLSHQKRLSLPVGHGRQTSMPSVPSIVVVKEDIVSSKNKSDRRGSSLERGSLSVPDGGAAGRRHSDGLRPKTGSLAVPDKHSRNGSPDLPLNRLHGSSSTSCLRLSREDLANLRAIDTTASPVKDETKLDAAKIQLELKTEFETDRNFIASYRQKLDIDISSMAFLNPLMSLGPPASSAASGAAAGAPKEYLPLGATELREVWRVQSAGDGRGEIRAIRGMCFTASGQLAVTEEKNSRVQIFNASDGQSLRILRETSTIRRMQPAGICHVPDKPILAVADLNRVVFLDHDFKGQWSTEVIIKNKTNLTGVAAVSRGALVLTDIGIKPTVGLFEPDGRVIREFQAEFERPQGVTVSHELGITFVSDSTVGCVYLFDHDGRLISRIGQTGDDLVRLIYPQGLCTLSAGTCLLVADRAQHRLVVYDVRNHAVDHLLTDEQLYSPICLASSSGGGGSGSKTYLAISEENQDFKVNDYELKMFRMKKVNRK